ncbi:MAG: ATP-dependent Clp protease ATP-binding subunit [Chlamydiales bacterium]|nr:ATP-dependent Clp protease ATP-binding subunit [Chlamydiales bacterium]
MSSINSVGESTSSQEITAEDVYGWHYDKASEYLSSIQDNYNPIYLIPSVAHLFGAMLTKFPGVGHVICAASKSSLPPGINYTIALNHKNYRRALDLAQGGADLSICNANGKNLVELLYGYDDELFVEAATLALKQDPSFKMTGNKTVIDGLLDHFTRSVKFIDLLTKEIMSGKPFDPTHPQCKKFLYYSLIQKEFKLSAVLIQKGVSFQPYVGHRLLQKLSTPSLKLPSPFDLGVLKTYVTDLTKKAEQGEFDYLITREVCLKRLIQVLLKQEKNHPMIYGKSGCGKTALVNTLAVAAATNQLPPALAGKRVLSLDGKKLLSDLNKGTITLDKLHPVLKNINGEAIIFIDNLEYLLIDSMSTDGNPHANSLSDLLRSFLGHKKIHWIGATNVVFKEALEGNPYIKFCFSEFNINETNRQESFPIIKSYADKYLSPLINVSFEHEVFLDLIDLCQRFVPNARFPKTPIEVLIECGFLVRDQKEFGPLKIQNLEEELIQLKQQLDVEQENASKKGTQRIEELKEKIALKGKEMETLKETLKSEQSLLEKKNEIEATLGFLSQLIKHIEEDSTKEKLTLHIEKLETEKASLQKELENLPRRVFSELVDKYVVAKVISQKSGVPINKLTSNEKEHLKELEAKLKQRVKGQEEAIKAVADTIRRSRLGLNGGNRPRGTFLFLGPTGVGKTELAKALAEELLGSEDHMIRIDMSEFQHPADINRLIGSAPGYVGYDEGGKLTEALKKKPYSVVLIDELEKAHPVCIDIFLQVFDDGRLTDGKGETVNCKEAVFIMTSNIGAKTYSLPTKEMQKEALDQELKETLRPEFINRIDDILRFNPLDNKDIVRNIAKLQLENLQEKVAKLFSIILSWEEEVIEHLTEHGFSPLFGARPLRNLVEKQLMTLISNALLEESLHDGGNAQFSLQDDRVILKVID